MIEQKNEVYELHKKLAKIYEKEWGQRKNFILVEYIQYIDLNQKDYDFYYNALILLEDLLIE